MIDNKTIRQVVINKALLPCTPSELEYHEAATAAGGYSVSFTTNVEGAVQDFVTTIVPKQSGTGDPSPDNVRHISGTDTLSFLHSIIQTPPSAPTVINIPLGQTVYGGEVDINGGSLTNNMFAFSGSDVEVVGRSGASNGLTTFSITLASNNFPSGAANTVISNQFSRNITSGNEGRCSQSATVIYFVVSTSRLEADTAAGGLKWLQDNDVMFVYELAEPTTAQITPVRVNTLKGQQKIENSKKFGFSLKYPIMVGGSCEISKQFLPIFYPNGKGVKHHVSTF